MTTKEYVEYKKIGFMSDIKTRVGEIKELRKELKESKSDFTTKQITSDIKERQQIVKRLANSLFHILKDNK